MVRPYYEHGGITLYHGDAREVLPALTDGVDVVLTDPPFGVDGGKGRNRARGRARYAPEGWEDTKEYVREVCVPVVAGCIGRFGRVVVTPGAGNLAAYLAHTEPADIGCLWSPLGQGFGAWGRLTWQPILYYGKDPRAWHGPLPNGITMRGYADVPGHPCPKALPPWKWLLNKASLPGETVLDPFVGSGTTLVAAKHLGRKAIGVEIEERHCELAVRRLAQEVMALE